ncbi:MAG: 2,3-bisphosphoglycerate-independent phosphoglycerate mutase [Patescibacteria group bacterium]
MPFSRSLKRLSPGPVVLVVWDGFGISDQKEGNPTLKAKMPVWQALQKKYLFTTAHADGEYVGLPKGRPGNSEAGHATMGAGRPVPSDVARIMRAIDDESFFENPALLKAVAHTLRERSTLHLAGLLTAERSGHASFKHLLALLEFVERMHVPRVALHLFTDGRDTHMYQAVPLLQELQKHLPKNVVIASLIGRFYAMDRNHFWERTSLAYHLIVHGDGVMAEDPIAALTDAYARGESDEFLVPTILCKNRTCVAPVQNNDAIIFWNLRSDRARQLIKPFVMPHFESREIGAFHRREIRQNLFVTTLTEFGKELDHTVPAFPHRQITNTLVESLRYHRQLYIAESEKFSQVTYFFNGGSDRPQFGEERIRIPSYHLARYSDAPEMRAPELAHRVARAVDDGFDFICVNFANADMVGHTGDFASGVKTCEALDSALGVIWKKVHEHKGTVLLVGDHGNIEQMRLSHGGLDTEHNPHPVPFLVAGQIAGRHHVRGGSLADVAPTVLALLGLPKPAEMTGHSLLGSPWFRRVFS